MTYQEAYRAEKTWHGKVTVMEIFHLTMTLRVKKWTLAGTADIFGVSIGLVSENLRLAAMIHRDERIMKCKTRKDALKKLR
jgi:hypothetical protein